MVTGTSSTLSSQPDITATAFLLINAVPTANHPLIVKYPNSFPHSENALHWIENLKYTWNFVPSFPLKPVPLPTDLQTKYMCTAMPSFQFLAYQPKVN